MHISDLSWSKKIKHPSEFCSVGDTIDVVVLELDKDNRRMSLGHKQLEENPWEVFETIFAVGSKHSGTVVKIEGNQSAIALPYGLEGSCNVKHLTKEDGTSIALEESAEFVVLEFNRNAKRITVSHTRTFEEAPVAAAPKERKPRTGGGGNRMMNEVNSNVERSTFGDLDVLSALKEQMEDVPAAAKEEEPAPKKAAPKKAAAKKAAPAAEEAPATEEAPAAKKAPAKKAATKKTAAKKPAAKKPAAKKPAAKKAPAKKATTKKDESSEEAGEE